MLARTAHGKGTPVIIVTNQSGIARGYFSEEQFFALTEWMCARFYDEGAPITAVYHCPYHPQATVEQYRCAHACRKPAPHMILAARKTLGLDLAKSILVGDQWSDIAARAAGVGQALLVGNNFREARPNGLSPDATFADVQSVARWFATRHLNDTHSKNMNSKSPV